MNLNNMQRGINKIVLKMIITNLLEIFPIYFHYDRLQMIYNVVSALTSSEICNLTLYVLKHASNEQ